MSRYQTYTFESANGAPVRVERHNLGGAGIADYYQNVQITAEGLDGGTFTAFYRVPGGTTWREHVAGATADDVIVLAGSRGPLADALLITFDGIGANGAPRVILNLWERL